MKTAILTIDDIASANTPAIVDYLAGKGIRPVMFAVGENVERYYDEAIYAVCAGITVGNHSYDHPHFSDLTMVQAAAEIEQNEAVLDRLYRDAGVERRFRPFRFPYGDNGGPIADGIQQYLRNHGFDKLNDTALTAPYWKPNGMDRRVDTYWTYDFEEYRIRPDSGFTFADAMAKLETALGESENAVFTENSVNLLLIHAHDETEAMFPHYFETLVNRLLASGVTFADPAFFRL